MKYLLSLFFVIPLLSFAQISDFKNVDFTIADNIASLNKGEDLNNLPLLTQKITYKLPTKVEKFRAIYTWVCNNIKGDANQNYTISRKRRQFKNDNNSFIEWNNNYRKKVFQKLIKHKKTTCSGYSVLIKKMCLLAGIECEIINGYGRTVESNVKQLETPNHSWNAVKLKDKWYLCDATWSAGYLFDGDFIQDYNPGYFLADPVLFSKNHYPFEKKWLLNDLLQQKDYKIPPLVYSETFTHKIIPIHPQKMDVIIKKNTTISFQFKSLKKIESKNISLVKFVGNSERKLAIHNFKNNNGTFQFKYFFKKRGTQDVHLKINKDIVATYVITVR